MNWIVVSSFLIIMIGITYYGYKKSKVVDNSSSEGFFLGGRSMTAIPIAGTIIMANLSTEQIVGQNGQAYVAGMEIMAWEVTAGIAIIALAVIFLPKYLKYGIDTIPELLEMRYDRTTKRIISALTIVNYSMAFLPTVFYSSALIFNDIFAVDELLGVRSITAVIFIILVVGVISILYLLLGGLSLSIHSNTLFGIGLLAFGLIIPFLGLNHLGSGGILGGIDHIVDNTSWLLNSVGAVDSNYVPWPTLFTGLLFNNLFYFTTNQMIVQKAFTARNLAEAQKGTLLVGAFKVIGALILVFPGVIARSMFGDSLLSNADTAYPTLVNEVLPQIFNGVFAAVIFGAILSTVIGALMSISTLFSLDFYKGLFNPEASDKRVASVGKIAIIIMSIIAMVIAPFIALAPTGLFNVIQEFNGIYNLPLLIIVLGTFYFKKGTAFAAKFTLVMHVLVYSLLNFWLLDGINFLYILSVLFFIDLLVFILASWFKPEGEFEITEYTTKVDIQPWKYVKVASLALFILIVLTYVLFSPLGLAG